MKTTVFIYWLWHTSVNSFTSHVHLGGLHDLLVDDKLWQRFKQRRVGMNEHRVIYKWSLRIKTGKSKRIKESSNKHILLNHEPSLWIN